MKILIDTTVSKAATVTLFEGNKEILTKKGTDALVLVEAILKENNLEFEEVDFELLNQPGSYTGLKIGASLVNALNFAKGQKDLVFPDYE